MKKLVPFFALVLLACSCEFVSYSGNASADKSGFRIDLDTHSGETVHDTLDLKDFNKITVNGQGNIDFVQSPDFLVVLHAEEGVAERLNCYVRNGRLVLERKDRSLPMRAKYSFTIQAPLVTKICVNGAADLDMASYMADENLDIEVNGAGDLKCSGIIVPGFNIMVNGAGDIDASDILVDALSVEVNGAGDAKLSGEAQTASFRLSGAGDIDARDLKAQKVEKQKNGVGKIRL